MLNIIIPARGGSKGVKNKNLRIVNSKSLVEWSMEAARQLKEYAESCNINTEIYLTSDSDEILSKAHAQVVADKRPKNLAQDNSLTVDVVKYIIKKYECKQTSDICLLQPTVPLRPIEEIVNIFNEWQASKKKKFNSLVSLSSVEAFHPFRMKRLLENGQTVSYIDQGFEDMRPRQELPSCYIRSGSYYFSKVSEILLTNSLVKEPVYGFVHDIDPVNIDTKADLYLAEQQLQDFEQKI